LLRRDHARLDERELCLDRNPTYLIVRQINVAEYLY